MTHAMGSKSHKPCELPTYSFSSVRDDYLVFSTQIQWYCIRMNQSVVSMIEDIHALYQQDSNGTLSRRQIWPIQQL